MCRLRWHRPDAGAGSYLLSEVAEAVGRKGFEDGGTGIAGRLGVWAKYVDHEDNGLNGR
jgi:hypothetical protein